MTLDSIPENNDLFNPPSSCRFDQAAMNVSRDRRVPADTIFQTAARDSTEYVRTIAALNIVLEMLERKITEIRDSDKRPHHTATLGHIRSALSYERKLLGEITDPQGMAMMTAEALEKFLASSPSKAVALLEGKRER